MSLFFAKTSLMIKVTEFVFVSSFVRPVANYRHPKTTYMMAMVAFATELTVISISVVVYAKVRFGPALCWAVVSLEAPTTTDSDAAVAHRRRVRCRRTVLVPAWLGGARCLRASSSRASVVEGRHLAFGNDRYDMMLRRTSAGSRSVSRCLIWTNEDHRPIAILHWYRHFGIKRCLGDTQIHIRFLPQSVWCRRWPRYPLQEPQGCRRAVRCCWTSRWQCEKHAWHARIDHESC